MRCVFPLQGSCDENVLEQLRPSQALAVPNRAVPLARAPGTTFEREPGLTRSARVVQGLLVASLLSYLALASGRTATPQLSENLLEQVLYALQYAYNVSISTESWHLLSFGSEASLL
jgi:hypothetical protein